MKPKRAKTGDTAITIEFIYLFESSEETAAIAVADRYSSSIHRAERVR